jgi:hypothetical protein
MQRKKLVCSKFFKKMAYLKHSIIFTKNFKFRLFIKNSKLSKY